jgi:hypothetical protein
MECFDVVQTVLDATYDEVPDIGGKRDQRISTALKKISDQYSNRLMTDGGPDFNDPATRFGYVYKYVPAHAHWLYELLSESPQAETALRNGKARITCIGGGPGSDVVGILKHLDENHVECKLFCELVDGCQGWKTTWSDLAYMLDWKDALHTDYVIHDVGDEHSWSSPSKIAKADIITLNFFVSEIYHLKPARRYLTSMLSAAKANAIVLMNDNRTVEVYSLIDSVTAECGYETIKSKEGERKIYDWKENSAVLKKYQDKFGTNSKLTGSMSWRIYQKK